MSGWDGHGSIGSRSYVRFRLWLQDGSAYDEIDVPYEMGDASVPCMHCGQVHGANYRRFTVPCKAWGGLTACGGCVKQRLEEAYFRDAHAVVNATLIEEEPPRKRGVDAPRRVRVRRDRP